MKRQNKWNIDLLVLAFLMLSLAIATLAMASEAEAEHKVQQVFQKIEGSLKQLKQENNFNHNSIKQVLTQYLLPEVDSQFFTYKVLAKNLQQLNEQQKASFIKELSMQLINTYTNLLTKYNNESISIERTTLSKSGKIAMVAIVIIGKDKTNKAIVKLLKSETNGWQFFDLVVEGISLLDTKLKEVNASIQRKGVDETLLLLNKINQT